MKNLFSLIFIAVSGLFGYYISIQITGGDISTMGSIFVVMAIVLGVYMAMNIGANDVANSVGPAVGSKTISLRWAILIAAVGNASGAMIAGGEVVKTIKKGIIDISGFAEPNLFIFAMLSALLAASLWLNIATYFRAPVSTTHSIVGGVMGAGIAALGVNVVSWMTVGKIAASWVISPVLGGIIAASFLFGIKKTIIFKKDKVTSAKNWVPVFIGIMAWAFSTYLITKGLKNISFFKNIGFEYACLIGLVIAIIVGLITKVKLLKTTKIKNNRESVNILFTIPLIFAVALLTFAHGANDVANAIGPIAAIYDAVINGTISGKVSIPFWILAMGGIGISMGLAIYGPRIIKTVGSEITELDRIRAFSIALAASITVLIASQLGLPVSSTHIALGGIFGVGFLREWLDRKTRKKEDKYVQRSLIKKIVAAWLITLPVVASIAGIIYLFLSRIFANVSI